MNNFKGKHTLLSGPFTEEFKDFSNPERRHIHALLGRYYELYYMRRRTTNENKEMKALAWVVGQLKELESV